VKSKDQIDAEVERIMSLPDGEQLHEFIVGSKRCPTIGRNRS